MRFRCTVYSFIRLVTIDPSLYRVFFVITIHINFSTKFTGDNPIIILAAPFREFHATLPLVKPSEPFDRIGCTLLISLIHTCQFHGRLYLRRSISRRGTRRLNEAYRPEWVTVRDGRCLKRFRKDFTRQVAEANTAAYPVRRHRTTAENTSIRLDKISVLPTVYTVRYSQTRRFIGKPLVVRRREDSNNALRPERPFSSRALRKRFPRV